MFARLSDLPRELQAAREALKLWLLHLFKRSSPHAENVQSESKSNLRVRTVRITQLTSNKYRHSGEPHATARKGA